MSKSTPYDMPKGPRMGPVKDSDLAWRAKADKIIIELTCQSYEQANRLPSGKMRKKHVPYSVPETAVRLIDALNRNDEHAAKSTMMYDYSALNAYEAVKHAYEGSEDPAARMKKIPRVASSR